MMIPIVIYSAGAIDLGTDIPNWRAALIAELDRLKVSSVLFDPSTAYKTSGWGSLNRSRSLYIERTNKYALDEANVFVVVLSKSTPSVGTPIECEFATSSRGVTHQFMISDIAPGKSVYLDNRFPVENWFVTDLSNPKAVEWSIAAVAFKLQQISLGNKSASPGVGGYADFD